VDANLRLKLPAEIVRVATDTELSERTLLVAAELLLTPTWDEPCQMGRIEGAGRTLCLQKSGPEQGRDRY
jgi:hypothetical protein